MGSLLVPRHRQGSRGAAARAAVALVCAGAGAQGCGKVTPASDVGFGESVLIGGVPHVQQKPDFCGEADVEMVLRYLGKQITQDQVFAASGMDPARGKGATTTELATALARLGFAPGQVWYEVSPPDAARDLMAIWRGLHRDLVARVPSIICMNTGGPRSTEHFRLVLGYDAARDEVIYHEPAEPGGAYRRMPRTQLFKLWPLKYAERRWTVVRLRLEAGTLVEPPATRGFSPSDFVQHVMVLRRDLPGDATVVVEPPFVVIGDVAPAEVHRLARDTIGWAVRRLRQDFFRRDPERIIDVWLCKDAESYRRASLAVTGEEPDTPYGYYAPAQAALVMNIATGGGTLVHEIVHPFMAANCPTCPAWFNEGLGSLYEQCSERRGHIVGLRNWRLAELQEAIRRHEVPSFRALTGLVGRAFYEGRHSLHYAEARYLLYALQEGDRLLPFYRALLARLQSDPTGYAALAQVTGGGDLAEFQRRWETEMLKL
jgi:hypothetical protein